MSMNIGTYSYEEYVRIVISFHGAAEPGLIIGGLMVDMALNNLPEGEFFNALSETHDCLPDSIQLLTSCTVGNGQLAIIDFGKFAVTMYEKHTGNGVRVYVDTGTLKSWPEINRWFLKQNTDAVQDHALLMEQVKKAGHSILGLQYVRVNTGQVMREKMGPVARCPICGEAYPVKHGASCGNCNGDSPYLEMRVLETYVC